MVSLKFDCWKSRNDCAKDKIIFFLHVNFGDKVSHAQESYYIYDSREEI